MQRASQVGRLLCSSWRSSRPRASPGCLSTPSCAGSQRYRERPPSDSAATAAAALVAAVALSHPVARLHSFAEPPVASDTPSFVRTHLVSGSGSGRWQFWTAAVDQWQSAPVVGDGAGTFAAWWAEHGSLALFVRNAHSLYLESLGELGAVGFLLASAIWVGGCAIGVRACRRLDGEERTSLAGATAVALAFGVGAGVDWLWQLPAVSLVGVSALALALGPPVRERARRRRWGVRAALASLVLLVLVLELVPLLAGHALAQSRRAAADGRPLAARDAALRAHALKPWATAPLRAARAARRVARESRRGAAVGRRGAPRECRRLAGSTPRGADRNPTRRDSRGAGRSSSGASSQPPVTALFETLTSAVHRHRRPAVLCTSRTDRDLVRGGVDIAVLTRVVDETQSPAAASAPTLPARRRFSHDSLRRRMLALADVTAVIVAAGAFWASGAPAEDAAAIVLFTPGWLLVAKACGLYDRDHRSIRCLTIDELGRIVGLALAGTDRTCDGASRPGLQRADRLSRAPALDPRRRQRLHVPRCRARASGGG